MISVLILTKNEQQDLPGCLASVAWSDDIHVYDSCSTDKTVEIAHAAGAHVTQRPFDNWAEHQNWGLRNIKFKHPWVFYLDADERMTAELIGNIHRAAESPGENVAFGIQIKYFFQGRTLDHVQTARYYLRLFRPEKMRYERLVNPVSIPDGPIGQVSGFLDHFPFSKGIVQWFDRHNSRSTMEAQQILANRAAHASFSLKKALLSRDYYERKFHQKELFYRMPARPLVKFLALYFLKRGFLDGGPGFTYSVLLSIYEYMIVLKTREFSGSSRS